jgi:PAS domain S-box-containing protein
LSESDQRDSQIPAEYFEQLCRSAGIAIFATDATMRVCLWNDAAVAMFGTSAEQVLNRPLREVIRHNRRDLAEQMFGRAIRDHTVSEFEIVYTLQQAAPRHLGVTVSPIFAKDGRCVGASACIRDITRRVELEKKLLESEKIASLGSLAGGVAHHFNNILGGVATTVDYALGSDDPAVARRALRITADEVNRASKITHDLLSFAEGDRRPDELGDLTETVLAFVDQLEPGLRERTIDLALDLNSAPVCEVPRHRLLTVLRNLSDNAIEAMPGGGQLAIALWTEGDEVSIEMTDTGCGIDEDTQRHVFEPFFTTKDATRPTGAGLGLAVVHGLVREMGGTISLHSTPGQGCQVEIKLPIHKPEGD